jgi:steroid delta-isomerase-like uncharacterized protein
MLDEDVKALCYRINELYNLHDLAGLRALDAPTFKVHSAALPGGVTDFDGWALFEQTMWQAFPDMQFAIQDMVIEGSKVVVRLSSTGTHLGEMQGIPPTGKAMTNVILDLSRYEDGLVQEEWAEWNMLAVMQQMGLIPAAALA